MNIVHIVPMMNAPMISQVTGMALTHLVEKSNAYAQVMRRNSQYLILDNSIVELGGAVSMDRLIAAAAQTNADEIILPDVFDDKGATIDAVKDALVYLQAKNLHYKTMAVCQGKNLQEFTECFLALSTISEITTIGIPKRTLKTLKISSRAEIENIWSTTSKNIHLLGVGESFTELLEFQRPQKIRSVDSSLLALLIQNGKQIFGRRNFTDTLDLEDGFIMDVEKLRSEALFLEQTVGRAISHA